MLTLYFNFFSCWCAKIYGFLFLLGSGLTYLSFSEYQKTQQLLKSGIKTTATVIELVISQGDDGPMYSPVFEFVDKNMVKQTFESGISSSPPAHGIGEKVKIIYSRTDINNVKTVSFWGYIVVVSFSSWLRLPF